MRALRAAGYDVLAVPDLSPGAPDEAVMALAASEERVLLTEDKDFGQLVYAGSGRAHGVVFIRYPSSARAVVGPAVVEFVRKVGTGLCGRFSVVQPGRARVVDLP